MNCIISISNLSKVKCEHLYCNTHIVNLGSVYLWQCFIVVSPRIIGQKAHYSLLERLWFHRYESSDAYYKVEKTRIKCQGKVPACVRSKRYYFAKVISCPWNPNKYIFSSYTSISSWISSVNQFSHSPFPYYSSDRFIKAFAQDMFGPSFSIHPSCLLIPTGRGIWSGAGWWPSGVRGKVRCWWGRRKRK